MILNNLKALMGHIINIAITVLLLKVFSYFYENNITLDNILFKLIVCLIIFVLYFLVGKTMRIRKKPITDFLYGFIIAIFGVLFFMIAKIGTGSKIFEVAIGSEISKFLLDLYLAPIFLVLSIFNIKLNLPFFIISILLPGILIGIGAMTKRRNIIKKRKIRQRRIYEQMRSKGELNDQRKNYRNI
ncbi:MAG: hypothetical protein Q4P29_01245 [Tissierellia bacterium]|nr:hypothetical protein [Tissierellia bacterium]